MPRISMYVFRRAGRKFFECEWRDPVTGRKRTRTTKAASQREAERFAAKLANELEEGHDIDPDKVTWAEFRQRYETEFLQAKAKKTIEKGMATIRAIEKRISPQKLVAISAKLISVFAAELRREGLAEFTVKGHLAEIRKMLRWANGQGMLVKVPKITMPRPHGMKGRPITREEFERLVGAIPKVVGMDGLESWKFLLDGLWLCGLRIEEAMKIGWDDTNDDLWVDLSGRRPLMRIRAHAHKARTEAVVPIAPDFGEFLLAVPEHQRKGKLFRPRPLKAPFHVPLSAHWVSKVISRIGKKAGVKVGARPPKRGSTEASIKWASAHDIRRAFGFRWSMKVMPAVLQQMMRHESIQTTMEFYVGRQAEAAADTLWQAVTDVSSDTSQVSGDSATKDLS